MAECGPRRRLADWLSYLETLHPKSIDLGLDRVSAVARTLGVIPAQRPTVTVAGTNGKGSCVSALQALLVQKGYSTGLYTSPHLIRYNERIAINGRAASDDAILEAFDAIESARGDITLSYFEFATLAALWLFQREQVDWQILEVGLGGRLDAVNCVDADVCVITSIGLDHTEWLGETRELIAPEKAGVARAGRPAVVAEPDLPATLLPALAEIGAEALTRNQDWSVSEGRLTLLDGRELVLPEVQGLQPGNLAAAVVALTASGINLMQADIDAAFSELSVPGRQQRVNYGEREWWFDVSHNRESVAALAGALAGSPCANRTHAVFGAMADKPLHDMLALMRKHIDSWHLPACSDLARAATPVALRSLLTDDQTTVYVDAEAAWEGVMAASQPGDRIVVFGSFVTVGAQLEQLERDRAGRETGN